MGRGNRRLGLAPQPDPSTWRRGKAECNGNSTGEPVSPMWGMGNPEDGMTGRGAERGVRHSYDTMNGWMDVRTAEFLCLMMGADGNE